jgi:hypothetical protein
MDERAKKRRRRRFLAYLHYWHALFGEIHHEAHEGHEVKLVIPFVIFVAKSFLKIKHGASQYAFWRALRHNIPPGAKSVGCQL